MTRPNQPEPRHGADLRAAADKAVRLLQDAGFTAYFAGGCVRDMLLGEEPGDYDVATNARPEQVMAVFRRSWPVGEAFGVVLVRLMGCEIEIATFRREAEYTDGRHPDQVEFCDPREDAVRRDFTINGMFYDPVADEIHDYVGGRASIERREIRAIGDADARFDEDYLRMLRAVRFAARLGYTIEPATRQAIERHADKLRMISRERIGMEVRMMLEATTRAASVELLQGLGLDAPTLEEPSSNESALRCLHNLTGQLPDASVYPTALAAWLLDRHLPDERYADEVTLSAALRKLKQVKILRRWRSALVLSNEQRDTLGGLLADLGTLLDWPRLDTAGCKRLLAQGRWPGLRALFEAVRTRIDALSLDAAAMLGEVERLLAEGVSPTPLVTGGELVEAGLKPGPMFKTILDRVYDAQLNGELTDQASAMAMAIRLAEELGDAHGS